MTWTDNGKIAQLANTLHAVGLEAGGMELLIHVDVDTVEMKGDGFKGLVEEGQTTLPVWKQSHLELFNPETAFCA